MKPRTTLILLIVAIAIGAFVWYDHHKLPDTEKRAELSKRVFPGLKWGDITRLELHNTNGVIVVEKAGDKWEMKQPYAVRANKSEIESILTDLEFLNADRILTAKELKELGSTPATYGLDKPRVEAILTAGGKTHKLQLGTESKVGGNLYAAIADRPPVYVIGRFLLDRLNKTVDELRDRTVVEFQVGQLTRLELKSRNRQIELARLEHPEEGTETWQIVRPIQARADKQKITDLANKLADLKVDTFVTEEPPDLTRYGLDEPVFEVTLLTKGAEGEKTVRFGSPLPDNPDKVYAKRKIASSIFAVSKDILTNLTVQVNDLRDRKLAEFDVATVKAAELEVEGQKFRVARLADGWEITEPARFKAEESACDDLLDHIHDAEIREFTADVAADLAPFGLDKPPVQLTLFKEKIGPAPAPSAQPSAAAVTNGSGQVAAPLTTNYVPLVTLLVGHSDPAKGLVYVKRADETFVYGLDTNFVTALPRRPLDLRDRTIFSGSADAVQRLEIIQGDSRLLTERVVLKGTNGVERREWRLVEPSQGILDVSALESAVASLAHIQAERLEADNPPSRSPYGLDQPALVARFTVAPTTNEPPVTRTLLVGRETPSKDRFAQLEGNPLVFEWAEHEYNTVARQLLTPPEPPPATAPLTNTPPPAAAGGPPANQ